MEKRRITIELQLYSPWRASLAGFLPWFLRWFLLLLAAFAIGGCTRIHQEDKWGYDALETVPESQRICVESEPDASLWVDGRYVGETPVEIPFSYAVQEIRLSRNRYRLTGSGEPEILSSESSTRSFLEESTHTLHFRAPGYHDRFLPLTIPRFEETLRVPLKPKTGAGFPVTVQLEVTALEGQLSLIAGIVARYDLNGGGPSEGLTGSAGPDLRRCRFSVTVADSGQLSDLLGDLFQAARERHFVFSVAEAGMTARLAVNPLREFRAVWVAYLDWPDDQAGAEAQKAALIRMLDTFQQLHLNAVLLQVRMEGDALYRTEMAPWSRRLTGEQGEDPGYDPLSFAVSAAHDRGIELHAWLNPYRTRLSRRCGSNGIDVSGVHVSRTHPEWLLEFRMSGKNGCCCYRMLDPGIPEVSDHIADIVADIVRRYDVDGIHFDDMFYPYPEGDFRGAGLEDAATYRRYNPDRDDLEEWRRDNINRMIRRVHHRIKSIKPWVRFGVSPFGIWRNGTPSGIVGMGGRDTLYSDALAWLEQGSVDYLTPQLYWNRGGGSDYGKLLDWWARKGAAFDRHIYPGQIVYYLEGDGNDGVRDKPRSEDEILSQVALNRTHRGKGVLGNVFYRAVTNDGRSLGEIALSRRLAAGRYATPALPPVMPWLDMGSPLPPENLEWGVEAGEGDGLLLSWADPNPHEQVWKYAIYAVHREDLAETRGSDPAGNLIAVTGRPGLRLAPEMPIGPGDRLYVTAVSRNNVESRPSGWLEVGY